MNYQEAILEQTIYIQRKSDALLGKHHMNYEQFCDEVDKLIPDGHMMLPIDPKQAPTNTREMNKVIGKLIHDETGKKYYEIYLSIKFNTTIL